MGVPLAISVAIRDCSSYIHCLSQYPTAWDVGTWQNWVLMAYLTHVWLTYLSENSGNKIRHILGSYRDHGSGKERLLGFLAQLQIAPQCHFGISCYFVTWITGANLSCIFKLYAPSARYYEEKSRGGNPKDSFPLSTWQWAVMKMFSLWMKKLVCTYISLLWGGFSASRQLLLLCVSSEHWLAQLYPREKLLI